VASDFARTGKRRLAHIPALDDASVVPLSDRGGRFWDTLERIGISIQGRRVVDLGAGFGSLSLAAARRGAAQVVAIDVHHARLQELRRKQLREPGVVYVLRADITSPPLRDGSADVVLLVGVVEYAGLWDHQQSVSDLQRLIIEKAYSILKPEGLLVLASKNRLWPRFALADPHTGDPIVNALPRGIANIITRLRGHGRYRHHIHSPAAWRALAMEAGFSRVQVLYPIFSYQFPLLVTPRPSLAALKVLSPRIATMPDSERTVVVGRVWRAKTALMILAHKLRLPLSHSVLVLARK
jgi:SAM-dependent methyltransferase